MKITILIKWPEEVISEKEDSIIKFEKDKKLKLVISQK